MQRDNLFDYYYFTNTILTYHISSKINRLGSELKTQATRMSSSIFVEGTVCNRCPALKNNINRDLVMMQVDSSLFVSPPFAYTYTSLVLTFQNFCKFIGHLIIERVNLYEKIDEYKRLYEQHECRSYWMLHRDLSEWTRSTDNVKYIIYTSILLSSLTTPSTI